MDRGNTNFSLKIIAKLKEKFEYYKKNENLQTLIKYYQFIPQYLLEVVNSKGILVFASPGLGKTRIAVNIASKYENVIVLEPQSLHNNFRGEIDKYKSLSGKKVDVSFVSSNAFNSADQFEKFNIKNTLLIVDEAHIFFKAIINSADQTNARRIYDIIMATPSVKLVFLTGTPCSKDIFELVPCFNMLAGHDLFPTQYETFYRLYVADGHFINREKFQNRILGLVSHVDSTKPTDFTTITRVAGDDGYFPVDLGMEVIRVEMSEPQYQQYLLHRANEHKDNKPNTKITKALSIPNNNNNKTYFVKSRMCSNFLTPPLWGSVQDLSSESFLKENSPKLHKIAEMMDKCDGKAIAYSQFVDRGLVPLARYLELLGYELYGDFVPADDDVDEEEITGGRKQDEKFVGGDDIFEIDDAIDDPERRLLMENTRINSKSPYNKVMPTADVFDVETKTPLSHKDSSDNKEMGEKIKNKKMSERMVNDVHEKKLTNIMKSEIQSELTRQNAIKRIRFANHLCSSDLYVDKYYNEVETEEIKKVTSISQPIEKYTWYDPNFKHKVVYRAKITNFADNKIFIPRTIHHGQRKLFVQELQLFNETLKVDQEATVLYAGSAPGLHIPYLVKCFPKIKFILWDPASFIPIENSEIHNDFFTDEVAQSYAEKVDYFISDIRIGANTEGETWSPSFEAQVLSDMHAQERWTRIIRPRIASLLKNRFPYIINGEPKKYKYMKGRIMMQTWASKSSTETRLLSTPEDYDIDVEYDNVHYENYCAYHNLIIRQWVTFGLGLDGHTFGVRGFDRCFDCANEYTAWSIYVKNYPGISIADHMNALSESIHQPLLGFKSLHGYLSEIPICAKKERITERILSQLTPAIKGNFEKHEIKVPHKGSYIMITGGITQDERRRLLRIFNEGNDIKFILMSEVGATGLDLKGVMETYQIEPYWEATRMKQFRFRALRLGSHDALPREKRHVKSYIFLSTANKKIHDQMIEKENKSIDEIFYDRSMSRYILNQEAEEVLSGASVECSLFGYGGCRVCAATNDKLFSANAGKDVDGNDPCKTCDNEDIVVDKIEFNGKIYYYKKNDESLLKYDFYEYNEDFGGYIPCAINNPDLYEIIKTIN